MDHLGAKSQTKAAPPTEVICPLGSQTVEELGQVQHINLRATRLRPSNSQEQSVDDIAGYSC